MITYNVVVFPDGNEFWRLSGKLHRENGPAVILSSGTKLYFRNGVQHRTDGPASEHFNGDKFWWLNGAPVSEEEFNKQISK